VVIGGDSMFYVDENGVFYPLGAKLLRDSAIELIPGATDISESIPGNHGDFSHGSQFEPRMFSLRLAIDCTPLEKGMIKRRIAKELQPAIFEPQKLEFAEDPGKTYYVKYIGSMETEEYTDGLVLTIPFKAGNPFAEGNEKTHVGSGTICNDGDIAAPVVIEIKGPISSPAVTIGGKTLKYAGTLTSADTLIIDTGKMTVAFNGYNAITSYEGSFPFLQPGETEVIASDRATFRWKEWWL